MDRHARGRPEVGRFHASDAFALPSHPENFGGIAVAEALGCALPVLISDKVNIWREVEADGAGIVETDTVDGAAWPTHPRWLAGQEARCRRRDACPGALDVHAALHGRCDVAGSRARTARALECTINHRRHAFAHPPQPAAPARTLKHRPPRDQPAAGVPVSY